VTPLADELEGAPIGADSVAWGWGPRAAPR
jgi:hypothetical protein